jgi:hypothetical protein
MPKKEPTSNTLESTAYMEGLFSDFAQQIGRYHDLTASQLGIEARLELAEKTLILTRDHLKMALDTSECSQKSAFLARWKEQSKNVRFVGMRLLDVCVLLLQEHKKLTPQRLLDAINAGTFRFRTNAPLREIHAAVLRHPAVKRVGNYYIWAAPSEGQPEIAFRGDKEPRIAEGQNQDSGEEVKPN